MHKKHFVALKNSSIAYKKALHTEECFFFWYTRYMNKIKKVIAGIKNKKQHNDEVAARKQLLEELFNDFNASRGQVYKLNFVRGIFFGFGSLLGGTLVVALLIALLNLLVDLPGGVGDFIRYIVETVRSS